VSKISKQFLEGEKGDSILINVSFVCNFFSPCEKIWGVQLCANNANLAAKACHILDKVGVEYDFVDLNMGCPLDPIYRQVWS